MSKRTQIQASSKQLLPPRQWIRHHKLFPNDSYDTLQDVLHADLDLQPILLYTNGSSNSLTVGLAKSSYISSMNV